MSHRNPTSAHVKLFAQNNASFEDAFRFGTEGDTSWSFTGQHFRMDVKGNIDDVTPLFTLSTDNGRIVVDDVVERLLHFNVDDVTLDAALIPNDYVYDLVMYDDDSPPIRVVLMHGELKVGRGITGD
jgi:hypothetical protein